MADEDVTEASEGTDSERLDRLEHTQAEQGTKLDLILDKLAGALPTHAEAEKHEEHRLERGSSIADQVAAELAKARAEESRKQGEAEHQSEHARLAEERARLREAPPAPPRRRATALLGWGDGSER